MQAVIVAGGKGTRLKNVLGDLPKPMAEVGGVPLLEHQIRCLRESHIKDILVLTGHGSRYIEEYFGNGEKWGVRISYRRECQPLGTAGAFLGAFDALHHVFLVLYGDTMLNVDFCRLIESHENQTKFSATIFLHPNDHPADSDLVELAPAVEVAAFHSYPHPQGRFFRNLVNAALYVVNRETLKPWHECRNELAYPLDFGKHVFPQMVKANIAIQGYVSREYIKDAGTPERLAQVRRDYESGRIRRGSLRSAVPAIFFDRDGTLNFDSGWVNSPDQLKLLPGAAEAVRLVNKSGALAVTVTNQPVIARGDCSEAELSLIHNKLEWQLGSAHAYLDAIYFCPHHPSGGYPGEVTALKFECQCRKPAVGLFTRARQDLNIDLERSWMIGDRSSDIEAARNLGIRSVLVARNGEPGMHEEICQPTHKCPSVLEAVRHALAEMET